MAELTPERRARVEVRTAELNGEEKSLRDLRQARGGSIARCWPSASTFAAKLNGLQNQITPANDPTLDQAVRMIYEAVGGKIPNTL